jgi:hypothetical protein
MATQPLKKKEVKSFDLNKFKKGLKLPTTADKPMEWFTMPKGFTDALSLPGIPKGYFTGCCGWNSTGKSTLKNCLIASAQRQGVLPVLFETESNFDFQYAINCGMDATPITEVDEETGEIKIVDYDGNFILFNNESICEYCGDMDYSTMTKKSTKRKVAVLEDIAYIINDLLDKQESGELPMELLFIWDSVGSVGSWKSYTSKSGNNMFDANCISMAFNTIVNTRIPSSRSQNYPYTNSFFIVNKIWDSSMATMGKPSVKLKGGVSFEYALRLLIFCGKIVTSGVKKLQATLKGEKYAFGTEAPISIKKNHLPTPYNVTYEGNIICTSHGIIAESELDAYKKKYLPDILSQLKTNDNSGKLKNATIDEIEFSEEETFE